MKKNLNFSLQFYFSMEHLMNALEALLFPKAVVRDPQTLKGFTHWRTVITNHNNYSIFTMTISKFTFCNPNKNKQNHPLQSSKVFLTSLV